MDFSRFLTDEVAEIEGVWKPIGGGAEVRIARLNNPNFRKAFQAKSKANRALLDQDDEAANELLENIMLELMARHVLKDVKGITVPDLEQFSPEIRGKTIGVDVPYSSKIGHELLCASRDFAQKIRQLSEAMENFQIEQEEKAVKNSSDG